MSTTKERLINCIDLCKNYKFDNAIKKCVDHCTHQHLVKMIIKPKPNPDPQVLARPSLPPSFPPSLPSSLPPS